jgi:kumamolisin
MPAAAPRASLGAHCRALGPSDLATFYDGSSGYNGSGQTIVIAGAYAWKDSDNTSFSTQWGLPPLPAGSAQVCVGPAQSQGCKFSNQNSIEVALDAEYAHAAAPGARILNYMAASTSLADFTTMYNRIVTDDPGHVVSTSWGACEAGISSATQQIDDDIVANANAIGQSWFAASGDDGSLDCNGLLTVDNPANSPHVIGVGGTTPTCSSGMTPGSPACGGYGSETGWSGSGGGISQVFARPSFQTGCGVPAGTARLVPDVALESDPSPGNYVLKNGSWFVVAGTSGAAPQWAGFFAQLNHKAAGAGLGNPGALLYGLCGSGAFHDIVSGSNGDYSAGIGYDMVTGLGTADVGTLVALAVPAGSTTTTTAPTSTTSTSSTSSTSTSSTTTTSTTTTVPTASTSSTSTTSSTSSTSTVPATSSTTSSTTSPSSSSTTTSTTATLPVSTSTTLPRCPEDGFAGLRCALSGGLEQDECTGDDLPRILSHRFGRALRLIDRAEARGGGKRARRVMERVTRALRRSARSVTRASDKTAISSDCGLTLGAMLQDGERRAAHLAVSL